MNIKLKPCPFCGSAVSVVQVSLSKYGVEHLHIDCCIGFDIEADEMLHGFDQLIRPGLSAVEKWNRRVGEKDE